MRRTVAIHGKVAQSSAAGCVAASAATYFYHSKTRAAVGLIPPPLNWADGFENGVTRNGKLPPAFRAATRPVADLGCLAVKSNAMLTAMGLHFARTGVGARYNAVMDTAMAHKLVELNNDFYRENGESFSQTRHAAWQGWHRALAEVEAPDAVLDIACGNARLKQFLEEHFSDTPFAYHGIDACPSMLPPDSGIAFQQLDLLSLLVNGENVIGQIQAAECELVVSFGFMHHVPTLEARRALLELVVEKTVPGGFAIVSFWQFARDERMRAKAVESTDLGVKQLGVCLDEGDYLLGWNGKPGTYRYCHSFSDGEIDELVQSVEHSVVLIDRFRADGRTGELNGYAVFCRR